MAVHICNPSTQNAESGGLEIQSQPGLHSDRLSLKEERRKKEEVEKKQEEGKERGKSRKRKRKMRLKRSKGKKKRPGRKGRILLRREPL
jgi:3'-phosphoadenosine 5'-phosphosulfate sulfotransferase (PAPS reductase)/FAD synthetase